MLPCILEIRTDHQKEKNTGRDTNNVFKLVIYLSSQQGSPVRTAFFIFIFFLNDCCSQKKRSIFMYLFKFAGIFFVLFFPPRKLLELVKLHLQETVPSR